MRCAKIGPIFYLHIQAGLGDCNLKIQCDFGGFSRLDSESGLGKSDVGERPGGKLLLLQLGICGEK